MTQNLNSDIYFALLGDVEPKPNPVFANFEKAIDVVNQLHAQKPFDFVANIGDIPHKGSVEQYAGATPILQKLQPPIFTIMGNEEMGGGVERWLEHVALWNEHKDVQPALHFVKEYGRYALVFATATANGYIFEDSDLDWLEEQVKAHADSWVILFVHAPARGIFDVEERRTIPNERFAELLKYPQVRAQISGHIHIDPDFAPAYALDDNGVHHIHAPGIERTKIGDKHTPRFRTIAMNADGNVDIQTYNLETDQFEEKHRIRFTL